MGRAEIRRFQRQADEVASFLRTHLASRGRTQMITHTDADGVAAAALLARCFCAYDVPFHVRFKHPLNAREIAELGKEDYDLFVFIDQGSSQASAIHKFVLGAGHPVLIFDHHPGELPEHPNLAYLNPNACGLDGVRDVSAAGVVYSTIEQIDKRFRSLIGLAVVGAIGDRQEFFSGFTGVNEVLVKRAIELDMLRTSEGLRLTGRELCSAVECLRLSIRPYLKGISGDLAASRALLDALGIPSNIAITELGVDTESRLRDALFARAGDAAMSEDFCHALWGTIYIDTTGELMGTREIGECVAMLDACCGLKRHGVGFASALGDRSRSNEAIALLRRYQEEMVKVLDWLLAHAGDFKLTKKMRWIYARSNIKPPMLGETLSLAMESGLIPTDRPLIGMVDAEVDEVKVSARATPRGVTEGVDLGKAVASAAEAVGGYGGGYAVSAAADIPRARMEEFIARLEEILPETGSA